MNNKFKHCFALFALLFALLIASPSVYANDNAAPLSAQSEALLQSLKSSVQETLLLIANTQEHSLEQFQYSVELPERQHVNLGLILELDDSQSAFNIISVTTKSLASAHGLAADNEITSVDGVDVNAASEDEILLKLTNLKSGDNLLLSISEQGRQRDITIPVKATFVPRIKLDIGNRLSNQHSMTLASEPDATGCGVVSVNPAPPKNRKLDPAVIYKVDNNPNSTGLISFKLPVGKHTVYVNESTGIPTLVTSQEKARNAKAVQINVRANTNYYLASKPIPGHYTNAPDGDDWEAVIWKVDQHDCQL